MSTCEISGCSFRFIVVVDDSVLNLESACEQLPTAAELKLKV